MNNKDGGKIMVPHKKDLFFWIAIITIIVLCRIQYIFMPVIDHFESLFSCVASSLMDGAKLYREAFALKPPLCFLPYHILFLIFGRNNLLAIHIAALAWAILIAIIVFKVAKYAYNKSVAYWATLFFAIFHTTINYDGQKVVPSSPNCMTLNAEFMMILPLSLAAFTFLKGIKQKSRLMFVLSGFFCGVSTMFHPKGLFSPVFLAIYLGLFLFCSKKMQLKLIEVVRFCLLTGLGMILGLGTGLFYIWVIGSWGAWEYYFVIQKGYTEGAKYFSPLAFKRFFLFFSENMIKHNFLLWSIAFFSTIYTLLFLYRYRKEKDFGSKNNDFDFLYSNLFFMLWLVYGLLSTFMHGARMFRQYWTLCFPSVMILAAYGFYLLKNKVLVQGDGKLSYPSKIFLYSFLIIGILVPIYSTHIRGFPLVKKTYGYSRYPIFEYIKENTREDDRIFMWGTFYDAYTFSNRISASPFLMNFEWVGLHIDVPKRYYKPKPIAAELFKKRFLEKLPKIIIDPSKKEKEPKNIYGPFIWACGFKQFPPITEIELLRDYVAKYYEFFEEFDGFLIYRLKEEYQNQQITKKDG